MIKCYAHLTNHYFVNLFQFVIEPLQQLNLINQVIALHHHHSLLSRDHQQLLSLQFIQAID